VRVLLDECIDWRLSREILGHDVNTVRQMGWTNVKDGPLLALAAERFDAFVTVDRNLPFQQNLSLLPIRVVVLVARSNRLERLKRLLPKLLTAIQTAQTGSATLIRDE
jgi:hypothetical protein